MSLLTVVQNVAKEIGLPSPSVVIGSSNTLVIQLLALANRAGKQVRSDYQWPQLNRETTITLVAGTGSYNLPSDFDYAVMQTHWDQTRDWRLIGPVSAQEWQAWKQGAVTTPNRTLFRVKGFGSSQIYVHPVPDAGSAGSILGYEYQSTFWIRTAAGSEGSKEAFTVDTDVSLLIESALELELLWRWRRAKRFDYQTERQEAVASWAAESVALTGSEVIDMAGTPRRTLFLDYDNIPETNSGYP